MIIPTRLYTLQLSSKNIGTVKDGKCFVLAFPSLDHVTKVRRSVSSLSTIDMKVTKKNDDVDFVQTSIAKRICINETMPEVIETSISDMIHYPFTKNVGVIFNIELCHEDRENFVFDGIAIEPTNNIEVFKSHLDAPS